MKKVFVTGGCGFIGSHFAEAVLKQGGVAVAVDNICENYDWHLKRHSLESVFDASRAAKSQNTSSQHIKHYVFCHLGDDKPQESRSSQKNCCMKCRTTAQGIKYVSVQRGSTLEQVEVSANFEMHHLDMSTDEGHASADAIFKRHGGFDVIVHLGGLGGVRESLKVPMTYVAANIGSTINVLQLAVKHKVPHVILASSSSVYGDCTETPFAESARCDAQLSPYAASKRSAELFCHAFVANHGFSASCCRFFTVYGPRSRPDMAVFKFIDGISKGTVIDQYGDGSAMRSYTYISDIVDGLVQLVNRGGDGYRVLNLGGDRSYRLDELILTIERHMGKKTKIRQLGDQPGDVRITGADQTLARQAFDFQPKVRLDEGIRKTVEWFASYEKWRAAKLPTGHEDETQIGA